MKIGVIIQARTGSSRYPRKIYEDINGKYTLQRVLNGVTSAKLPHNIILAMPEYDKEEFQKRMYGAGDFVGLMDERFNAYFGHPDDLLERYFLAAREHQIDLIVRITGDCPLIQGWLIDEMLVYYLKGASNAFMGNNDIISAAPYPNGTDVEIFPYWMLAEAHLLATSAGDREHVAPFMYSRTRGYKVEQFMNIKPNSMISMKHPDISFDTEEDFKLITKIATIYDECGDLSQAINTVE